MNVLFLTLSTIENLRENGIYLDLINEFSNRGINIYVVSPREKRMNLNTELIVDRNIKNLRVRIGNITKTKNFIEKGISTLLFEYQYLKAIKKYFRNVNFDLLIYSTPPISYNRIIKYFKKKQIIKTYLMLKDIFPQNAVDLGLIKKNSIIYKYFRQKEKELYKLSDYIGCMSKANVEYILKHNPYLNKEKVEIFPNSILPKDKKEILKEKGQNKAEVYDKYNIPSNKTLFIYGGNLGKPQGIDFLIEVMKNFDRINNSYLLIVGDGTEFNKLRIAIHEHKLKNVKLIKYLPKNEYNKLLSTSDVGLIFLDNRFTIPNFPSRLTSYMEYGLPVLAATDKNTDIKDVLIKYEAGFWCESGDIKSFIKYANALANNKELREKMGENGRNYLEKHFDIRKNIDIILNHFKWEE
ncbi:MAG: hypothetical protein PWQ83_1455 [Thermosipho sp. (in: thermotogales)]|nr:hypothetical protein [Thermosipho sp. (in: thermotogales)]